MAFVKLVKLVGKKRKGMKKRFVLAMMLVASATAIAQDDGEYRSSEIESTISSDVVSSYIWRGQDLGSTAVQPTLGVGYKGFSLSAWGMRQRR